MNTEIASSKSHNFDIEAQTQSHNRGELSRTSSLATTGSRRSTSNSNPSKHREERSRVASADESGGQARDVTETPRSAHQVDISSLHDTLPPTETAIPEWKPWKADDPLLTKIPKSETTMEDWVGAMEASDDGMCKGWREQIDNLVIFAGLFSATVTAFTVESYQWLEETPADTLARLQLRILLNATHDPASMDRLAPATFNVNSASVAINTLWFASLTLSLAAVVISILCKQWLYEYQRYDNFTTREAFLIHGLRHRGLQAWRVPEIVASLPILLQTALVLFLAGILVLLWPLQTVVVSVTTTIVGLTFLFLGITTALPSIQYIFPHFDTQCAYKSSQSWSLFFISAFWIFDFGEFTSWASFDQWEVTRVYNGMGSTLSRVYKLLCNSDDAVLSVYSFLADTSLKPIIKADLALLSDFVDQLDPSQRPIFQSAPDQPGLADLTVTYKLQRLKQLKGWRIHFRNPFKPRYRIKPRSKDIYYWPFSTTHQIQGNINRVYHLRIQSTLGAFLQLNHHIAHPALFNRSVEHWARGIDVVQGGTVYTPLEIYSADIQYDPEIAMYLVGIQSHLIKADQFNQLTAGLLITKAYLNLMESYHQHKFNPPPVTLLKDIQEWIDYIPEISRKGFMVEYILLWMAMEDDFLRRFSESHTSEMEKQYLISFARFFVTIHERDDILAAQEQWHRFERTDLTLAFLRTYLDQNDTAISSAYSA